MRFLNILAVLGMLFMLASCGGQKKSDDIIAQRVVKVKPKAPADSMSEPKHVVNSKVDMILTAPDDSESVVSQQTPAKDNHLASMLGCLIGKNN